MQHRFSRQELYDLVWEVPMQQLAKRFGISDVGLAKACRKAGITDAQSVIIVTPLQRIGSLSEVR